MLAGVRMSSLDVAWDVPGAGTVRPIRLDVTDIEGTRVAVDLGTRLLAAADDRFRRDGMDEATLWVFAANAAARGFYSRLGWQPDGGERVEPQYGEPELRLRRTLRDGAGSGGAA